MAMEMESVSTRKGLGFRREAVSDDTPRLTQRPRRTSQAGQLTQVVTARAEEAMVADPRAGLSPAQMVEHKLLTLLNRTKVVVSPVRSRDLCGKGFDNVD